MTVPCLLLVDLDPVCALRSAEVQRVLAPSDWTGSFLSTEDVGARQNAVEATRRIIVLQTAGARVALGVTSRMVAHSFAVDQVLPLSHRLFQASLFSALLVRPTPPNALLLDIRALACVDQVRAGASAERSS